jgi:hypothetical protein
MDCCDIVSVLPSHQTEQHRIEKEQESCRPSLIEEHNSQKNHVVRKVQSTQLTPTEPPNMDTPAACCADGAGLREAATLLSIALPKVESSASDVDKIAIATWRAPSLLRL